MHAYNIYTDTHTYLYKHTYTWLLGSLKKQLMLSSCVAGEDLWVPWKARRSNQSILRQINPEYSLEGLVLNLKPQYFGHLMRRADSLEKTLMLGKICGQEEKRTTEGQMDGWHHQLNGHEFEQTPEDGKGQGSLARCSLEGCKELDMTEWLKNNKEAIHIADTIIKQCVPDTLPDLYV